MCVCVLGGGLLNQSTRSKEWKQVAVAMAATSPHTKELLCFGFFYSSQQIYITSKLVINVPVLSWQDELHYQSCNYIKLNINGSVSLLIGGTIRNKTYYG